MCAEGSLDDAHFEVSALAENRHADVERMSFEEQIDVAERQFEFQQAQ